MVCCLQAHHLRGGITVQLLAALQTPDVTLAATPFRPGTDIHDDLAADHPRCVPHHDLFTELYCPADTRTIAMQYEVHGTGGDQPIGWATLMELDPHARHVRAGVFVDPCAGAATGRAARLLTTNIAFAMWNVRKVYSWEIHGSWAWDPPGATPEGTLREYLQHDSHHLDMDVIAIYRADWDAHGAPLVEELVDG
jgi:hypothetical protein